MRVLRYKKIRPLPLQGLCAYQSSYGLPYFAQLRGEYGSQLFPVKGGQRLQNHINTAAYGVDYIGYLVIIFLHSEVVVGANGLGHLLFEHAQGGSAHTAVFEFGQPLNIVVALNLIEHTVNYIRGIPLDLIVVDALGDLHNAVGDGLKAELNARAHALKVQIKGAFVNVCFFAQFQYGDLVRFFFNHQRDHSVKDRRLGALYPSVHFLEKPPSNRFVMDTCPIANTMIT